MRPTPAVRDALKRHILTYDNTKFTEVIRCLDGGMTTQQIANHLGWEEALARNYERGVDAILNGNMDFSSSPSHAGKAASKVRRLMRNPMEPEVEQYLLGLLTEYEGQAG